MDLKGRFRRILVNCYPCQYPPRLFAYFLGCSGFCCCSITFIMGHDFIMSAIFFWSSGLILPWLICSFIFIMGHDFIMSAIFFWSSGLILPSLICSIIFVMGHDFIMSAIFFWSSGLSLPWPIWSIIWGICMPGIIVPWPIGAFPGPAPGKAPMGQG